MAETFADRIYTELERRILCGDLKPNDRIPSLDEISESFGSSRGAVRYAIRRLVNRGLLHPIHGKGTFVGAAPAAQRAQRSSSIAVLIMEREYQLNRRTGDILSGVEKEASYRGLQLVYNELDPSDPRRQSEQITKVLSTHPYGAIHIGVIFGAAPDPLRHATCPLIMTGDVHDRQFLDDVETVTNDQYAEGILVANHIASTGHRRIGFITSSDGSCWGLAMRDGFTSGLHSHGLTIDRRSDISMPALLDHRDSYRKGIQIARTFAENIGDVPTVIYTTDNTLAIAMIDELTDKGIRVPQDISICTIATPAWQDVIARSDFVLSGIAPLWKIIGHVAVKRLTELWEPGARIGRRTITGEWVTGTTLGPPRA